MAIDDYDPLVSSSLSYHISGGSNKKKKFIEDEIKRSKSNLHSNSMVMYKYIDKTIPTTELHDLKLCNEQLEYKNANLKYKNQKLINEYNHLFFFSLVVILLLFLDVSTEHFKIKK